MQGLSSLRNHRPSLGGLQHDVCDRPWWRDRCPPPYCCRCPVGSIGTCQLHTLHTACRGWNLEVPGAPGPEITGRFLSLEKKNCLESATSTRYDRYEYIWGLFLKNLQEQHLKSLMLPLEIPHLQTLSLEQQHIFRSWLVIFKVICPEHVWLISSNLSNFSIYIG